MQPLSDTLDISNHKYENLETETQRKGKLKIIKPEDLENKGSWKPMIKPADQETRGLAEDQNIIKTKDHETQIAWNL